MAPKIAPLPWTIEHYDEEDGTVTYEIYAGAPDGYTAIGNIGADTTERVPWSNKENAKFIERAVNNHDSLLSLLREVNEWRFQIIDAFKRVPDSIAQRSNLHDLFDQIRAAITKAEGK